MNLLCRILFFAGLVAALSAHTHGLTVAAGDGGTGEGVSLAAAIVEGHPAIVYSDSKNGTVKFVRASDARGTAWGTPVTVAGRSGVETKLGLVIASGNPAVCYYDAETHRIKYSRATDATGGSWAAPVELNTGTDPNSDYAVEIIDGNPAVCFTAGVTRALKFIRALDANGTSWGAPVDIDGLKSYFDPSLRMVAGRPAVASLNEFGLWYARAEDAAGAAWREPAKVIAGLGGGGTNASMQVVNGKPAVAFLYEFPPAMLCVRAADAEGIAWRSPVSPLSGDLPGFPPSLAVINGKPAIAFADYFPGDIKYVECTDSDGETAAAWSAPVAVDNFGKPGKALSLLPVDGLPALVYHSSSRGSLEYRRAVGIKGNGSALWPPDLAVEHSSKDIPNGGLKDFGVAAIGSTANAVIKLKNPYSGSTPLNVQSVSIDGPDAAEFSMSPLQTPAGIGAAGALEFTLQCTPVTPGLKSATLRILSDAEMPNHFYTVRLTANSLPAIEVERSTGIALADGETLRFPFTAPGGSAEMVFFVRNTGGSELNGLAITIDGPNAAEFSVSSALVPILAPDGKASFTVRHAPAAGGQKTAALHIASSITGAGNPFDVTLRMVPGMTDFSFSPLTGTVTSIAVHGNGKILTGGRNSLISLNADGSPDISFFSPSVADGFVRCIAVQKDGRILIGGDFERVGGLDRSGLARVLPDGTVDLSFFNAPLDSVECLAVQPDGKILAGGNFAGTGALSPRHLVRLNADGSFDHTFNPRPNQRVRCVALQPDGRILVGGWFTEISQVPADRLARLNPDGTPDNFYAGLQEEVRSLAVQPDGRVWAGGYFDGGVARLLPDGRRDPSMTLTANGDVYDLVLQADGGCIIAGTFDTFGGIPRAGIARIHPGGTLDDSFNAWSSPRLSVQRTALQSDGKVLIFGDISDVSDIGQLHLTRLDNDAAPSVLANEGRSVIRWLRSGTAPEVSDVSFDLKPDNSNEWTPLGPATRVGGGWELTGLTLPSSGILRARARAGGSLIESVTPLLTPLESWRLQHFNITASIGVAADNADPDHDGLTNFIEFAFGLSPVDRNSNGLPEFTHQGTFFAAAFTSPENREDVIYSAEWSATMDAETWRVVPDEGDGAAHRFRVPAEAERAFVRWIVKMR